MTDLKAFLLFVGALLLIVGVGEALRTWADWKPESSRRVVHLLTGLLVAFGVPMFSSPTPVYILAAIFVVVNLIANSKRWFKGMHGIDRESWGTVTFPLALIVALFLCWTLDASRIYILQTAFLVLAVSDPLASFVGTRLKNPKPFIIAGNRKSVAGSTAFFVSAWLLTVLGILYFPAEQIDLETIAVIGFITAIVTTAVEMLSGKGWDNLTIVLAIVALMAALSLSIPETLILLAPLALVCLFAFLAYKLRFLDYSGALAAGLLGYLLLVGLPVLPWLTPPVVFFVFASLLSKIGKRKKKSAHRFSDKSDRRDAGQVVANGGVGGFLLILSIFVPSLMSPQSQVPENIWFVAIYWAFVGSFAAAAADTWATEIGTFFRWPTWRVLTRTQIEPGESGGISVPGLIGAMVGSLSIFVAAWAVDGIGYRWFLPSSGPFEATHEPLSVWLGIVIVGSGLIASLVDSILGATVQAQYGDSEGRLTERSEENGVPLPLVSGYRWMTNDRVNLVCTAVGALIPFLYFLLVPSACPWCIR